ncbi:hypothetical protein CspHIS471_0107890 [Cutaneotrichosporon sp. HIS471]|nr:hypothetical protein CspHIS471_0107890 [Cutaneotrichosporon sp. HIS471]
MKLLAALLLAPLALAQGFTPHPSCLPLCDSVENSTAKCQTVLSDQVCLESLCQGSGRTEVEKCYKCTADANGDDIATYWSQFDERCKEKSDAMANSTTAAGSMWADTQTASPTATGSGAGAMAVPVVPALAALAIAAIVL